MLGQLLNFLYVSLVRPVLKWLITYWSGKCELMRISEGEQQVGPRTFKIEDSLQQSKNGYLRGLLTDIELDLSYAVREVMRIKHINKDKHPWFPPSMQASIRRIRGYRNLIRQVEVLRKTPYNSDNEEHENLLIQLWESLKPDTPLEERISKQWGDIGFQGNDPSTDFRGMGMLGLYNLIHLVTKHKGTARQILSHADHPEYGYSFAIVGINLTSVVYQLLISGALKSHMYSTVFGQPSIQDFHRVYYSRMDSVAGSADKKLSSQDFAEQIRQLELEGSRLREAVSNLGNSLTGTASLHTRDVPRIQQTDLHVSSQGAAALSLSALTDISQEQKTLSDLRTNLDFQMRETGRITQQLLGEGAHRPVRTHRPTEPLTLSHLSSDLPLTPQERQLKQAQDETAEVRRRLREALNISEEQKLHFRQTIADLKQQLQDVTLARDNIVEMKQTEAMNQEMVHSRLQNTVDQMEQASRAQDKTLSAMKEKTDTLQHEKSVMESAFNQIRCLLLEREQKNGQTFSDSQSVSQLTPTMVSHLLERHLADLDKNVQDLSDNARLLEHQMELQKAESDSKIKQKSEEFKERLADLTREHERESAQGSEQTLLIKKQANNLQDQIRVLHAQQEDQVKVRDEKITELESSLKMLQQDFDDNNQNWKEKHEALQLSLDEAQRELHSVMTERDEAIRREGALESRLNDNQLIIKRLETDLDIEKAQTEKWTSQDADAHQRTDIMKIRLREKDERIVQLEQMLSTVKQECELQLHQKVNSAEKQEQQKHTDHINLLSTQVSTLTEKVHQTNLDYQLTKQELNNLRERHDTLKQEYDTLKQQLDSTGDHKDRLGTLLTERHTELEQMTKERDYYFNTLEDRNTELAELRTRNEKLSLQLEEREKNMVALQQQNQNITQMVELNSKTNDSVKAEREKYRQEISERLKEITEIKQTRDELLHEVKFKENKISDLEADLHMVKGQLEKKHTEVDELQKQKETLFRELKDSRYEVATVTGEKEKYRFTLESREAELMKEVSKLSSKLRAAEKDLKLARRALKTQEHTDGTAVKMAGKMQREVTEKRSQIDFLHSQVGWLEECMDNAEKDKKVLTEQNQTLSEDLQAAVSKAEQLIGELTEYQGKHKQLKVKVSKLESALEKAAMRFASSQGRIEQQEQDIARLKLQHHLQLKELQRGGHLKNSKHVSDLLKATAGQTKAVSSKSGTATTTPAVSSKTRHTAAGKANKQEAEKPYRQQDGNGKPGADLGPLGTELRSLMGEMRILVQEHKKGQQEAAPVVAVHTAAGGENGRVPSRSQPSLLQSDPVVPVRQVKSAEVRGEGHYRQYPSHPTRHTGMRKPVKGAGTTTKRQTKKKPVLHSSGRSSPTHLLIGTSDNDLDSVDSVSVTNGHEDFLDQLPATRGPISRYEEPPVPPQSTGTHDLCQRLEKKLQSLTKLGTCLQEGNREAAAMIEDQDRKLKQMKQNRDIFSAIS